MSNLHANAHGYNYVYINLEFFTMENIIGVMNTIPIDKLRDEIAGLTL